MKKSVVFVILTFFSLSFNSQAKTGISDIKAYAKAEVTIEQLRKQKEVNWKEIAAQYEITAKIVKDIDSKHGTNYDKEILEALKKCEANENPKVNQQIIGKGLQHVTVLAIQDELKNINKSKLASQNIAAFFEGIRPTFQRRDKDFFEDKKNLENIADQALKTLLNNEAKNQMTSRMELENILFRTYALSVLFEVIEIESIRESNLPECDVKRMEAQIFYRIIQPQIKKKSPSADEAISKMLSGSYATMNAKFLEENLSYGRQNIKN
ncbi:MAG: hypothetical protein HQK79_13090 [Desulfobacterales bacterium]|nr:hypothetical protein [Desulfobacterales bacterium]